jgi:hypothetical protein
VPTKKDTGRKTTVRKATAKRATGRKTTVRKATAKRATAKRPTGRKTTVRKARAKKATPRGSTPVVSQPRMTPVRRAATSPGRAAMPVGRTSRPTMPAQPGDFIVIDSPQVGSLPREGEVLEVIQGEVSVSYRVQWADGHQTLIGPTGGTARIVRASERT